MAQPVARARLDTRSLWTLLAGNAISAIGIGFFLPLLPLFVRSRGGTPLLVGLILAAGMAAKALAQYPAGRMADRWGRRPVLVGSMLIYALLFPLYTLPIPVEVLVVVRFAHALAGGGFMPAALALAADLTPERERGRVYTQMRASDTVGLVIGPALGGLVAGLRLDAVFWAGAILCLLGVVLLLRLPRAGAAPRATAPEAESRWGLPRLLWLLFPVLMLAGAQSWVFGTYDTVWSLFMTSRGASPFVVGLSFTTYAVPIVLLAGLAGGLADRLGHMRAGLLAVLTYGLLASLYPFVPSVIGLVLLGVLEGTLTAAGLPGLNAAASRRAPPGAQGRTQGAYQLGFNVAQVGGAVAGGWLYGLRQSYAFFGASAVCLVCVAASLASGWMSRQR